MIGAASLALCAALPAVASSTNLITNGDFETGGQGNPPVGFETDFRYTRVDCCAGAAIVGPHISFAFSGRSAAAGRGGDHTTGTGDALFVNGSTNATQVFWRQTVSLTPMTDYTFGIWGTLWFGGPSVQALKLDGVQVGSFTIDGVRDAWSQDTLTFTTGAGPIGGVLELVNLSTGFSGNDFAVDDLTLTGATTPVPTPLSAALMISGLGGLVGLRRIRRQPDAATRTPT
jgi:hypothetical protein